MDFKILFLCKKSDSNPDGEKTREKVDYELGEEYYDQNRDL